MLTDIFMVVFKHFRYKHLYFVVLPYQNYSYKQQVFSFPADKHNLHFFLLTSDSVLGIFLFFNCFLWTTLWQVATVDTFS